MKGIKKLLISSLVAFMTISNSAFIALAEDEEPKTEEPKEEQKVEEPVQEEVVDNHNYIYYLVDGTTIHFSSTQEENYQEFDTLTPKESKDDIPWLNTEINNVVIDNEIKPTTMAHWFEDTTITEINLKNLNTENLINTNSLFKNCGSLVTIKVKDTFNLDNVTDSLSMFEGCSSIKGQNETIYDETKIDKEYAIIDKEDHKGYLTDVNYVPQEEEEIEQAELVPAMTMLTAPTPQTTQVSNDNGDKIYWGVTTDNKLHIGPTQYSGGTYSATGEVQESYGDFSQREWNSYAPSITEVIIDGEIHPTSTAYWFGRFYVVNTFTNLNNIKLDKTETMEAMFSRCTILVNLDVSSFDTSNVTNMADLFSGCEALTYLDLTSFKTSNVIDMEKMFNGCTHLETIRVSNNFVTSQVTSSVNMFGDCTSLIGGNGSTFQTGKTNKDYARIDEGSTNRGYFTEHRKIKFTLGDVEDASISQTCVDRKVGEKVGTLPEPSSKKYLFEAWKKDTTTVDENYEMPDEDITVVAKWQTIYWGLKKIDATDNYTLHLGTSAYVQGYDYKGNTNGSFDILSEIPWIEHANKITAVSIDNDLWPSTVAGWFARTNITSIDLSKLHTKYTYSFYGLFANCTSLTSVDLSSLDTSSLIDAEFMFSGCSSLKKVELVGTNWNTQHLVYSMNMFDGCSSLEEINLGTGFSTASLTNTSNMFSNCVNLKTIYAPSTVDTQMSYSDNMFYNCPKLVGGQGTKYDATKVNGEYAIVDLTGLKFGYYTDVECKKIEFVDGATEVSPSCISAKKDSTIGFLPSLEKTGMVFDGWYTEETGGTKITSETTYDGTYTKLYAHWSASEVKDIYWGIDKTLYGKSVDYYILHLSGTDKFSSLPEKQHGKIAAAAAAPTTTPWAPWLDSTATGIDITTIKYVETTDPIIPKQTAHWFEGMSGVVKMELSYLILDKVTNIVDMFKGCSALTTIWVTNNYFNIAKFDQPTSVFDGCTNLVGGNGTTFFQAGTTIKYAIIDDTSKGLLTDGEYYKLTLDSNGGSGSFTKEATFTQGQTIQEAYGSLPQNLSKSGYSFAGWYTKPTSDGEHVDENTKIKRGNTTLYAQWALFYWSLVENSQNAGTYTLHLSKNKLTEGYKTGHSDGVYASEENIPWYQFKDSITKVVIDTDINAIKTTAFWFASLPNVTTIEGINKINTASVIDMSSMFEECSKLTSIGNESAGSFDNTLNFITTNVQYFSSMFAGCKSLTYLNLNSFKTTNAYYLDSMFEGMSSIKKIEIRNFTSSQTYFDTSYMFKNDGLLETILVSDSWTPSLSVSMFENCKSLIGGNGTIFAIEKVVDGSFAKCDDPTTDGGKGYFTKYNKLKFNKTSSAPAGASLTQVCKDIAPGKTFGDLARSSKNDTYIFAWYDDETGGNEVSSLNIMPDKEVEVFARWETIYFGTKIEGTERVLYISKTAGNIPEDCISGTKGNTDGIFEVRKAAWGDNEITKVKIFDEIRPIYTCSWFEGLTSLVSIEGLSNINTKNCITMVNMFKGCSNLENLDLSTFDTSNVGSMRCMFAGCTKLQLLNLSNFVTTKVEDMGSMFYGCENITNLDLTNFYTPNLQYVEAMFYGCKELVTLTFSKNFSTNNVIKMNQMFDGCKKLQELNLSNWNTSKVTDTSFMFRECNNLSTLRLSNDFKTENSKYMQFMFYNCSSLTTVNLNGISTKSAVSVDHMFSGCEKLTSNNPNGYDLSNCKDMDHMFYDSKASYIKVTRKKQANADDTGVSMSYMFANCPNLTTIVFDNFDTSDVTDMSYMFLECPKLTSLDLSKFDTSKVTTMKYMLATGIVDELTSTSDSSLTNLNISSFNTSSVTDMSYMFYGNSKLTSITFPSTFITSAVKDMQYMFYYCQNLTSLDVSKFNTQSVINMAHMFDMCRNLKTLDVTTLNTSSVTNMAYMFRNCMAMTDIKLVKEDKTTSFVTNNVTTMDHMFSSCPKLTVLDLSKFAFKTDGVNIDSMFKYDNQLKTIYVGSNPTNVTGDDVFFNCISLMGGKGTKYNASHKGSDYAKIDEGPSSITPGYFTKNDKRVVIFEANCKDQAVTNPDVWSVDLTGTYGTLPDMKDASSTWVFEGWYTKPIGGDLVTATTPLTGENVTLYGHWRTIYWGIKNNTLYIGSNIPTGCDQSGNTKKVLTSTSEKMPWGDHITLFDKAVITDDVVVDSTYAWFYNYTNLKTVEGIGHLILNNVTNPVTDMSHMFDGCSNLTTITTSTELDLSSVTTSTDMFKGCVALVGGAGTKYDATHIDKEYARIDKGATTPGYFTYVAPPKPSPTPDPGKKDESCEKVIGPTWHWNNSKGICEDIGVVGTSTR